MRAGEASTPYAFARELARERESEPRPTPLLSGREFQVLSRRSRGTTYLQIAVDLDVAQEGVRRIERTGLRKLLRFYQQEIA